MGGIQSFDWFDIQNKSFEDITQPEFLKKNDTIRAGELQADNRTLVLSVDGENSSENARIVWFDIVTRHTIRQRVSIGGITALATTRRGIIAIVDSSGTAEVISSAELAEELRKLKARRVVLLMDSCESGALMSPLEGVIAANIQQSLVTTQLTPSGEGTVPPHGVLLLAASSGFESAVSTAATNPFMDKLASLLSSSSKDGAWAHAIAEAMRSPIIQTNEDGSTSTMTPVPLL